MDTEFTPNDEFTPGIADALFSSSNGFLQPNLLPSSRKKRVPNEKEMHFIDLLRKIKDGLVCEQAQFDPALSNQWREMADGLLEAMQEKGIDGFWKAYTAVSYDSAQLKEWRPLLDIPAARTLKNALYRAGGSIAFIAMARSGLMVLKDPTDESKRVLAHVKSNLSMQAANLVFSVVSDQENGDDRPYIRWLGQSTQTLQELLNPPVPTDIQQLGAGRQEILRVLEEHNPEALSVKALAEELPEISNGNLRVLLKRMAENGQIAKSSRGEYRALSALSLPEE